MSKKKRNTSQSKPSNQSGPVTAPGPVVPDNPVKGEKIFVLAATLIAAVLILYNLGNTYLWSDEAHTALLGRTILSHGVPKGTDGFNSYSVDIRGMNSDMNKNGTWILTPWLFYYVAAPFTLFPPAGTEWLLRLPFALFGIFTVPLTFLLARRFFDRRVAVASVVFLVTFVPFLLYARQCRYYSMAMFFSVWLLLAYDKFLKNEKNYFWHAFLSQLFLFHTNYMIWAGMAAGMAVHFFLFSFDKKRMESLFFLGLSAGFFHLPWVLMSAGKVGHDLADTAKYAETFRNFLIGVNNHLMPLGFFLAAFPVLWFSEGKVKDSSKKAAALFMILLITNIAVACFSTGYFFRYLVGVMPAALIVQAFLCVEIFQRQKIAGIVIVVVLAGTNLFAMPVERFFKITTWATQNKSVFRVPLADYFYELTHEYRGPVRGIVEYLRRNARDGQKLTITYEDLALKYYLPRLRILGGMTGENLTKEGAAVADWIIPRHFTLRTVKEVNDYILANVNMGNYEKVEIDYPDYTFENIPEPEMHLFRTATDMPKVLILKKR